MPLRCRRSTRASPEYNSEFTADIAVHTPALLTRPVVHLYDGFEVTHNMAIVEWDIDAAQQSDTKTSLQLLEGSKLIYNFSKWGLPSAKYKFPRFVFGGLKANTTYTARIQRISADASKFGDSGGVNISSLRRRRRIIPTVSSMPISTNIGGAATVRPSHSACIPRRRRTI